MADLVETTHFGFYVGVHDVGHDRGKDVDGSISWWYYLTWYFCLGWVLGPVAEVELVRGLASRFFLQELWIISSVVL